jgi:adenylate cyclase 1
VIKYRHRCSSFVENLVFFCFVCKLCLSPIHYLFSQFTCQRETTCTPAAARKSGREQAASGHRLCLLPHYVLLSCMLSYLAVSIFLRLPIAIKSLLLGAMGTVYILLIELSHAPVFACWDIRSNALVPLHITAVIVSIVFVLAVALHGRQVK